MSRELPHPITVKEGLPTDVRSIEETRGPDDNWHFRLAVRWPCEVAPMDPMAVPGLAAPKRLLWLRRRNPAHDIQVVGHYIDREIDPHHWLQDVLREQNREVVSENAVPLPSGITGDMVATWRQDGVDYAGRFFASKWGPRMFLLSLQCRREDYSRVADDFFDTLASFEAIVAQPEQMPTEFAELVFPIALEIPVKWKTFVPDSWRVQLSPKEKMVAGFVAANLRGGELNHADGMLSMGVAGRKVAKKPRKAARMFLDAIKHNAISLEHRDFVDEPKRKPFQRIWCCVSDCDMGGAVGEMRCRVMMSKRHWVVAGMLGPRREHDSVAWAENKRALDIATHTLELE